MRKFLFALLALLGLTQAVYAQQAAQQQPSHLDAAVLTGSTTAAVSTAVTLTLPAVAGKYHQITRIDLFSCQDSTGAANPTANWTTSNLGGLNGQVGAASAAGGCWWLPLVFPSGLLSSAPGTATTISLPVSGAHSAPIIDVYYSAVAGVAGNQ